MAEEEVTEAGEGKGKRRKLKLIILIVVGVLLIAGLSVFGTWFMLKDKLANPEEQGASGQMSEQMAGEPAEALYYAMDPAFIINYTNAGKSRFLQVELTLMTRDPEALAIIEQHNPLIRNNLLDVFSMQDINTLASAEGKQKLADELAAAVQAILDVELGRPGLESVLYRSFIIQ